jgi:formate dehydrogenase subunit gamma
MRALSSSCRPWRFLLAALVLTFLGLTGAGAAVPNNRAEPAYAEEQTILQAESDSKTPEPGLDSKASGRVHIDRHYLGQYGANEGTVIVQRGGNTWRRWRNGPIATAAGTILVVTLVALFAFYRIVGPARTDAPDTGRRIQRFTGWERAVHWATAITFIILALTGLLILFGKKLLIPLVGHDVFSFLAYVSKYLHNFVGPLFTLCSVVMFFTFLHRNFLKRIDWVWVKRGGGLFNHTHVPAGFFNAGEKAWFWLGVTFLGLIMSASGFVLDFATFGQTRYIMQVSNYLHLIAATFYIAAAMGHSFIGTWGTPGAYEAMRHGTVDETWARAHHPLWLEEVKQGLPVGSLDNSVPPDDAAPPADGPAAPRPRPAH